MEDVSENEPSKRRKDVGMRNKDLSKLKKTSPRALLLRVAVDTSRPNKDKKDKYWDMFEDGFPNGGFWGPLWEDEKKFEYIPVPEIRTIHDGDTAVEYMQGEQDDRTYGNTIGMRLRKPLIKTINDIPERPRKDLSNVAVHNDPDFATLTYGDVPGKGRKCADLKPGDLLVFCTTLQDYNDKSQYHRVFIIGYFTVKASYDFENINPSKRKKIIAKYKNKNAHFSSAYARVWGGPQCTREKLLDCYANEPNEARLVLVVGKRKQNGVRVSGLFRRAVKLTEEFKGKSYYIHTTAVRALGLNESPGTQGRLDYHIGSKWVNYDRKNPRYLENLRRILAKGEGFC